MIYCFDIFKYYVDILLLLKNTFFGERFELLTFNLLEQGESYQDFLAKVSATRIGNRIVASPKTLIAFAPGWIFPQEIASSGKAPASLPSNSWALLM